MAYTPHPKDIVPPLVAPAEAGVPLVTPREGTEPAADRVPHHGGGFAKTGGAYSGGCVAPEEPPPPEGEALSSAKADTHAKKG